MENIVLYGGGGHAKVVKECLDDQKLVVEGFMDDDPQARLFNLPYLKLTHEDEIARFFIITIGNNRLRKKISEQLDGLFINAIHPSSLVSLSAKLGTGCMILHRAIIQADCRIGNHVIVNTAAQIDHDCVIDNYVHIGPGAILCGNVSIGEGTLIGAGAVVLPGIKIGRWVTIGAGTVVNKPVADGVTLAGVPGIVIEPKL